MSDFDNDGFDDLVLGVRGESIGAVARAGAANVLRGSAAGLTAVGNQLWHQNVAGIVSAAELDDLFASALASGDFNNDGFDDLALGVRGEGVGAVANAGAVNVLRGSGAGLTATGNQIWHQDSAGILDVAESGDAFGSALAVGDFDNDGFDDLAVGARGEDVGTVASAGALNVLRGSAAGLTATGNQIWHQDSAGIAGAAESWRLLQRCPGRRRLQQRRLRRPGDRRARRGRRDGCERRRGQRAARVGRRPHRHRQPDLAPGQRRRSATSRRAAIRSAMPWPSATSTTTASTTWRSACAVRTSGRSRARARSTCCAGRRQGSPPRATEFWHQDSPGVANTVEAGDAFGTALASADFNGDGFDDLAVGVPGEDVGGRERRLGQRALRLGRRPHRNRQRGLAPGYRRHRGRRGEQATSSASF